MVVVIVAHRQFETTCQASRSCGCDNGPDVFGNGVERDEHAEDDPRAIHEIRQGFDHATCLALADESRVLVQPR